MSSRYSILGHIAKGGMASVYLGRMSGSAGFTRLVAIKRLHPEVAAEREFVAMLVDEAKLAAQIRHINVIDTLDLVVNDGAFSLVLEYIDGDSLSQLVKSAKRLGEPIPREIALAVMVGVLKGLDAAHEARGVDGHPLGVVHRDVSPQNVLVGIDGVPRVIDFGVAKAVGKLEATKPGEVRGKFSYMAPEQMQAKPVTRQVDVYAAGVMLWELLAGERLFTAEDERAVCAAVLRGDIEKPSTVNPDIPSELDEIVLRATAHDTGRRHFTARELLDDLEKFPRATDEDVGEWVRRLTVERRAQRQRIIEGHTSSSDLRSIEDVMNELGAAGPGPGSASAILVPATPKPRPKMPLVALGAGVTLALLGIALMWKGAQTKPAETPASPPAPIVASTSVIEDDTPAAKPSTLPAPLASTPMPSATPSTTPSAKPNKKPSRPSSPNPDPASFR